MAVTDQIVAEQAHAALVLVVERITPPERWTRRAMAETVDGDHVGWTHPDACRWCLDGAVLLEVRGQDRLNDLLDNVRRMLFAASDELYPSETGYIGVNDHLGHPAALAVARRAVELAASRAGAGVSE